MQHPAEYEAALRAEREHHAMYSRTDRVANIDAELARIGRKSAPATEDAAESAPRERAVPAKRTAARTRKAQ